MSNPTANPISTMTGQQEAGQYGFTDPYSASANMSNALFGGQSSPLVSGPMGTYNQNANNVMGQIAGLNGPEQQTLSGIAQYQANNALNQTASSFANQGALGSGAAAQAFGQAIANPFAQAQAQLQQGQLGSATSALTSLMNTSGNAYNTAAQAGSNLMEHTSGLVAPVNYTNPQYTQQAGKQNQLTGGLLGSGSDALGALSGETLLDEGDGLAGKAGVEAA